MSTVLQIESRSNPGDVSKEATAHRLKLVRLALGFTQARIAEMIGTTVSNYQHMEAGATYPQPFHIERLRLNHGIDHNFIYCGFAARLPAEVCDKLAAWLAANEGR